MKSALVVMLAGLAVWSMPALARDEAGSWWLGVGLGAASVDSPEPAPSAGRGALAASIDFGHRFTPQWGLGLEFGAVVPKDGCPDWECPSTATGFAPNITSMFAVGEFRPHGSRWRLRAGAGVSRFCYRSHWSDSAWNWVDTLDVLLAALLDDVPDAETFSGGGAYRCDARRKALGGSLSVGYDWPLSARAPVSMGLRLRAEAASFEAAPAVGLPAFKHRVLMLTLHLNIN